ncbi:OmpP1/FadL family transporter [Acinetobacter junii]|uniref:Outer membrane protein transport protein n=2 Tax=Acinetobacter TaxID=469 RepID=A0AAW5R978_ACIJU|nr:outer membrane protein transport protein [Acinetobacter junii]MCU4396815.1 outer membrane protein transport protein [Acinetobacter junii]
MKKYYLAGSLAMLFPLSAHAFNGILLTGTGQVSAGMGGVSIAAGADRTSISENPANLSFQNAGADAQLALLSVHSKANFLGQTEEHKSTQFIPIPSWALVHHVDNQFSIGLSSIGAGASVDYDQSALHGYPADNAKDNLAIVTINPSFSYRPIPELSIGLALNLGIEQFRAKGVLAGTDPQGSPVFLPSHGNQWAYGFGYTLGSTWNFQPDWYLGISYISETQFTKLDGYKEDLLAQSKGRINLPERYGIGLKYNFNKQLTLAADFQYINWEDSDGLGKDSGFNWQNQKVYRLGLEYQLNDTSNIRLGYNHANKVVDSKDTLVNFYANAVANQAWTVGYGHRFKFGTLNLAYEYALDNEVKGTGTSLGTNLKNENHVITLGLSKDF